MNLLLLFLPIRLQSTRNFYINPLNRAKSITKVEVEYILPTNDAYAFITKHSRFQHRNYNRLYFLSEYRCWSYYSTTSTILCVVNRRTHFTVNNTMYASKVEVLNLLWKAWYSVQGNVNWKSRFMAIYHAHITFFNFFFLKKIYQRKKAYVLLTRVLNVPLLEGGRVIIWRACLIYSQYIFRCRY